MVGIKSLQNCCIFTVKVAPAASKTSIEGEIDGMLKVKLSAAPEKGKANEALIKFLAGKLAVKKKFITIISGQTSKIKQLAIDGITEKQLAEKLYEIL